MKPIGTYIYFVWTKNVGTLIYKGRNGDCVTRFTFKADVLIQCHWTFKLRELRLPGLHK